MIEAIRHSFDGYGWQYIDSGSGSDWRERGMSYPDAEPLYTQDRTTEMKSREISKILAKKLAKQLLDPSVSLEDILLEEIHRIRTTTIEYCASRAADAAIEEAHRLGQLHNDYLKASKTGHIHLKPISKELALKFARDFYERSDAAYRVATTVEEEVRSVAD